MQVERIRSPRRARAHANIWLCYTWTLPRAVGRVDVLRVIQNEVKKTDGWTDLQQGYWQSSRYAPICGMELSFERTKKKKGN